MLGVWLPGVCGGGEVSMFAPAMARPRSKASAVPGTRVDDQARRSTSTARDLASATGESSTDSWSFANLALSQPSLGDQPTPGSHAPALASLPPVNSRPRRPAALDSLLAEPGRPLEQATRSYFESSYKHDLSSVRLHTGDRAEASAAGLSARAYTVGRHIVLGRGAYAPQTAAGRQLLGHELAHVIQQSRGGASPAETPALEASARQAASMAGRGQPVAIAGAGTVGIARQSMFDEFSAGKYSWPFLKLAIHNERPVASIVSDINALSSAERDQAVHDLTAERISEDRKFKELVEKFRAQKDEEAAKKLFTPMAQTQKAVLLKIDEVLDGVFAAVSIAETKSSLKADTVAPTAAQKSQIDSALKPDQHLTAAGTQAPFQEDVPGDPKSYLVKLREATPDLIKRHYEQQVKDRGPSEHSDPAKIHPLSEMERIGNASKDETDKVFGQYKKGSVIKADTKGSRGNIHDLWQETDNDLKGMSKDDRSLMARRLVFYFFQTDAPITAINRIHDADPKFSKGNAPINDEAKDQKKVVDESTNKPEDVKRLNEIDRGWDASEIAGGVNVQLFKKPDETTGPLAGPGIADRDFLWDMFQTLVHEYIHTLVHPDYLTFAESFGDSSAQFNTLVEGVDSLLDEVVWSAVAPRVTEQVLRDRVEGPVYAKLPPFTIRPASRRRYPSMAQAVKLVNVVGIRNLYAAYFLGDVRKIKV